MTSRDGTQRRARQIQRETGWSYSECLRLSREDISPEALEVLKKLRASAARGRGSEE